jgi:hypothetical protein
MTPPDPQPPRGELGELDRSLSGIRFRPRESLGAEIAARATATGAPAVRPAPVRRRLPLIAACLAGLGLAGWIGWTRTIVAVDRCCYDLDGGADRDDGVLVLARRNEEIRRLAVYEDRDGSRSYSQGDVLRFSRGPVPSVLEPGTGDLISTNHCCLDFDGGGPQDDGILVVGVPPDRVMMAALYEQSPGRDASGQPLR